GDDRAEHQLEDREIGEVELRSELACVAHACPLEAPPERNADRERCEDRAALAEGAELEERKSHVHAPFLRGETTSAGANAPIRNSQLPTLSNAPPVSAWPLVHPRASTAPMPMIAPPANAATRREPRDIRGPRSTAKCMRPASHADNAPPI